MTDANEAAYEAAIITARRLGAQDGAGAPGLCDLSGQWADVPGGPAVFATILGEAGVSEPQGEEWSTEVLDAYEDAYNTANLATYDGHPIRLEWETVDLGGFAYTNWLLFVDGNLFYLGQDAKFVARVLGRDFAEFIREAFNRAGILEPEDRKLAGLFDHDLLRASLAWGIVDVLVDVLEAGGGIDAFAGLEPWAFGS